VDRRADGARARPRAARLGGAEEARLVGPVAAAEAPPGRRAAGGRGVQKNLAGTLAEAARRHPDTPVEVWTTDEHRLGLKPIRRRVWAPVGERPLALGHHRYEWLYVTAFVQPTSGETVWYLSTGIDKRFFEALLAAFARQTGAGRERIIVLVLDNAGWHSEPGLAVPDGIRLVFLPPYSPELQPAERLWPLVDEPIVNRHVATLADLGTVLARRCSALWQDQALIAAHTNFHWWPKPITRN
jgi:hypothetical protein